jgi:hypothetical protein
VIAVAADYSVDPDWWLGMFDELMSVIGSPFGRAEPRRRPERSCWVCWPRALRHNSSLRSLRPTHPSAAHKKTNRVRLIQGNAICAKEHVTADLARARLARYRGG